jgi:hypothetical protein
VSLYYLTSMDDNVTRTVQLRDLVKTLLKCEARLTTPSPNYTARFVPRDPRLGPIIVSWATPDAQRRFLAVFFPL